MAIRNLRYDGDELLRKTSKPVTKFDESLHILLDDMRETMHEHNGMGIAAPQVGILKRAFVIEIEDELLEFINPEIVSVEGDQQRSEGCLSIPKQRGVVERPLKVTLRAQNRHGEFYEATGEELLAVAMCHEFDHLNGVLYTDKVIRMLSPEEMKKDDDEDEE